VRRAIVTSTATVSGIILVLGLKSHGATAHGAQTISIGSAPSAAAPSTSAPAAGTPSSGSSGSSGSSSKPSTSTTSKASTGGTRVITGASADTRYGPVQLKVTFSGKQITKIDVIQYPTQSGRDQEINNYALPVLNQEAMSAQSATIDSVSGATYTSDGYTRSLQSAIDQAAA
jgi:uncharacterized protein with FMN-binding domain